MLDASYVSIAILTIMKEHMELSTRTISVCQNGLLLDRLLKQLWKLCCFSALPHSQAVQVWTRVGLADTAFWALWFFTSTLRSL